VEGLDDPDRIYADAVGIVKDVSGKAAQDLARQLRAARGRLSSETRYEEAARLHELIRTGGGTRREAENAADEAQRHGHLRVLCGASTGWRVNLFHLRQRTHRDRRGTGDQARFHIRRKFFASLLKQALSGRSICSRVYPTLPVEFEDCRAAGSKFLRATSAASGDPHAAVAAKEAQ